MRKMRKWFAVALGLPTASLDRLFGSDESRLRVHYLVYRIRLGLKPVYEYVWVGGDTARMSIQIFIASNARPIC